MRTSAGFLLGTLGRLGLVSWCSWTLRPQPKITSSRRSICRCTGTAGVNGPILLCIGLRLYCQRYMVYSAKPSRSDKGNAIQISYVLGLGIPKHIEKVGLSDELRIRQYWAFDECLLVCWLFCKDPYTGLPPVDLPCDEEDFLLETFALRREPSLNDSLYGQLIKIVELW
jgi:hypothetical protein